MNKTYTHVSGRIPRFFEVFLIAAVLFSGIMYSQPASPVLVSPLHEQLNVTTSPLLSWNAAAGTGSISYHLQVSLAPDFSSTVYDNAALTGITQTVTGLANDTIYFWRVLASDDGGAGAYSTARSFTTNPKPVQLGTAADFKIFANTGITGGAGSSITGDIGVASAAATITGFGQVLDGGGTFSTSASVTGRIYAFSYAAPTPTKMTAAASDMATAYTDAANRTPAPVGTFLNAGNGAGEIGGLDLGPGLYKWTTAVTISNDLTLTGNATDVWIFQLASTLSLADAKQITLVGGALASNIFWQVAGQVTLVGTSAMKGNILGQTGIAFGANGTLDGKALAQTNVTLITNTILPVELVSFSAATDKMTATLRWTTATETDNYGFEIERTIDNGKLTIENWNNIGFVDGAGTTNSSKNYSYTDNNLSSGTYSYRLKQIDRDGKFEYSNTIEATISQTPLTTELLQNYPNPFNPSTKIGYTLAAATQVRLKVYSLLGTEVATLVNSRQEAGSYTVLFSSITGTSSLTSGVYIYRLEAGSVISTKKLILMK